MIMISTDAKCRPDDPSLNPSVGEIERFDAFSEGTEMLLRAMADEFDTPDSTGETGSSTIISASKAIAAELLSLRAYVEAAAARFEDPHLSTVTCIKPNGRSSFAA